MQVHGSCVARNGAGVLLLGPSGAGKSDLALRLVDRGFMLVADDRVEILAGRAAAPEALAGLLEVRGLGIMRVPFLLSAQLTLAVELGRPQPRLPAPQRHAATGLPLVALDAFHSSTALRVEWALAWLNGETGGVSGAFLA